MDKEKPTELEKLPRSSTLRPERGTDRAKDKEKSKRKKHKQGWLSVNCPVLLLALLLNWLHLISRKIFTYCIL